MRRCDESAFFDSFSKNLLRCALSPSPPTSGEPHRNSFLAHSGVWNDVHFKWKNLGVPSLIAIARQVFEFLGGRRNMSRETCTSRIDRDQLDPGKGLRRSCSFFVTLLKHFNPESIGRGRENNSGLLVA
jgi:hypothetical protein